MPCATQTLNACRPNATVLFIATPEGLCAEHYALGCEYVRKRGGYWVPAGLCRECGEDGIQVRYAITVSAGAFRCRPCRRFYALEYRVPRIITETPNENLEWDRREDRFDFLYAVRCKRCGKGTGFEATLVWFMAIKEIKLVPKRMVVEWDCS
jgi:hypothetical protein